MAPLIRHTIALVIAIAALGACRSQGQFLEDQDWTKDRGVESGMWRDSEALFGTDPNSSLAGRTLRGVRQDLTLKDKVEVTARCNCMDVVVGRPQDPRFRWAGQRPTVAPTEEVVAVRTRGSLCSGIKHKSRRPSIRGVDVQGSDVTIVIEELPYDRPQALGAIVARPRPGGTLFLRPRKRVLYREDRGGTLPYGKSGVTSARCTIYARKDIATKPDAE